MIGSSLLTQTSPREYNGTWAERNALPTRRASEKLRNQRRAAGSTSHMPTLAGTFANDINPLLFGMLLAQIIFRVSPAPAWRYILASVIGMGIAVGMAEAGKICMVLPGSDTFPSGHETFGASACTCLCRADRSLIPFSACVLILLAWALVTAHYHVWRDVFGGAALGTLLPAAVFKLSHLTTRSQDSSHKE